MTTKKIQGSRSSSTSAADRTPPHSNDAEQAVLGAMLIENKAVGIVGSILGDGKHFYTQSHQEIYETIMKLFRFQEAIDITTVANELERTGNLGDCGGRTYLSELASGVATAVNAEHYAKIVLEKSTLRQIIGGSTEIITRCFRQEETVEEILDAAMSKMIRASATVNRSGFELMTEGYVGVFEELHSISSGESSSGLLTGLYDLDRITCGFQPTLIIIAARPTVGKSAFIGTVSCNMCANGKVVGVISMDMPKFEFILRNLCAIGQVDSMHFREGKPSDQDWTRISDAMARSKDWKLYVDDSPDFNINTIASKIWSGVEAYGMDIVFVDHLQKIRGGKKFKRNEQISEYTGMFFRLSRELEIPIVVASQLGRQVEDRKNKRPKLSDLKDSGDIEQDAKQVIGLYRPILYASETEKSQGRYVGQAEAIVLKNTGGPTGTADLIYVREHTRFDNIETANQTDAF